MKKILFILLLLLSTLYAKSPKVVEYVNPKLFSGLWYEIARTYNSFEHDCVASSVEYYFINTNQYKVFNRCFENEIGSNLITYKGQAKAIKKENMSRIKMTYFWIFSNTYNVIYLNDYKTAVVASDDMEYVWLMSRKPKMNKNEFNKILELLKPYINIKDLIITPQDSKGRYK